MKIKLLNTTLNFLIYGSKCKTSNTATFFLFFLSFLTFKERSTLKAKSNQDCIILQKMLCNMFIVRNFTHRIIHCGIDIIENMAAAKGLNPYHIVIQITEGKIQTKKLFSALRLDERSETLAGYTPAESQGQHSRVLPCNKHSFSDMSQ